MESERVDRYLGKVISELEVLPEHTEEWEAGGAEAIDEQDAYETEWASVALARMDRLEWASRSGAMSPEQEERYGRVKALFRERMPLIERYGLEKPTVPLED